MFKQIKPQAAFDDERGLLWGTMSESTASLRSGERELIVTWESGRDREGKPLCIIYLDRDMSWQTPDGTRPLTLLERQQVKEQIHEAALVLGYSVSFVDEAPAVN